ncbi:host cell division inhibitor Icd-like protein [Morganella morganii]|uniref:host cell division inhibitor Icd-like protein n=1 Tax=Morganella morganii TaxID=582 RepID=UPI0030B9B1C1
MYRPVEIVLMLLGLYTNTFNLDRTTPRSATNTIEASNHNVNRGNSMAMYKSTQTHPKFKWRFFSCQQSRYFTVEARSEQEARSMLPDAPCLFSARIRQGVNHA